MPKKKTSRNGLYWFMQDLLPELRREGRVFPNGMPDVLPIAFPRWEVGAAYSVKHGVGTVCGYFMWLSRSLGFYQVRVDLEQT